MGTGKTVTALALAKKNKVVPLIVCPKMLKEKWRRTAIDMLVPCLVLTKEEFRRDAAKLKPYPAVIVDEAHYGYGNTKSQLHKLMYAYIKAHDVSYVWLLTGTPYTSSPMSVFALARLLGKNWHFLDFRSQFFREQWFGRRMVWQPREGIEDELARKVWEIGSIVRLDDCIDVPDQLTEEEILPMTKAQEKAMKEVLKVESNPLARFTKYHQIATGVLLGDEFTDSSTIENNKTERILEIADENKKFVVFSRYNAHLRHLGQILAEKGFNCLIINGETKNKDEIVSIAEKSDKCVVLINTACSVGYELPSFDVTVYCSLSYSFVDFEQSKGRTLRINNPHKNLYVVLLAEDSVDMQIWESIKRKQNFSEAIYAREKLAEYEKSL